MRLLLLALLGFLSIVIHGHGVQDENGVAEVVSDVISLNENKGDIKTVDKRAAEAGKKQHNRPDSKRRTNKIKRQQGKKLSKKRRNKKKKESKKKRKNSQRSELNKKNRRRTKKKANRKGKRRRKGGNRNRKKNQISKGKRNKPKKNKKKRKGNAKMRRGNQKKKQARKTKPQKAETNKKIKKKKRKNEKKKRNKKKLKRRNHKNRKRMRQENKFKKTRKDKKPGSSRALNCTNCVVTLAKYSRTYEGKCGSILRQYRRIQSFEKITKSKLNKKGSFVPTYNSLLSALGGNKSSPHCDGQTIGSNSSSQGYKDALSTLNTCESTINSTCKELLSEDLNKTLTNCYDTALRFRAAFSQCLNSSLHSTQDSICNCVDGISTTDVDTLKTCNTKTQSQKQKSVKKKCVDKYLKCKSAEDLTVEGQNTCKKPYKCGGALNPKDAEEQLALAKKIKAALEATEKCHGEAMASLGLTSGPGDDGQVPSKKNKMMVLTRQARQTGEQGCKELEQLWERFNQSANTTAEKFNDKLNSSAAATTTEILGLICARNLTADLASCAKETRQITTTVTILIVRIRIYIFWCRQWLLLIELKITIITVTFGLPSSPSPSPPSPAPPTSTRRTARRVNEILTNLKNKRMGVQTK